MRNKTYHVGALIVSLNALLFVGTLFGVPTYWKVHDYGVRRAVAALLDSGGSEEERLAESLNLLRARPLKLQQDLNRLCFLLWFCLLLNTVTIMMQRRDK
jgi:hypothetical protein